VLFRSRTRRGQTGRYIFTYIDVSARHFDFKFSISCIVLCFSLPMNSSEFLNNPLLLLAQNFRIIDVKYENYKSCQTLIPVPMWFLLAVKHNFVIM
jgi:hypothetical protein